MRVGDRINRALLAIGIYDWRWLRALFAVLIRVVRLTGSEPRALHVLHMFGDRLVWSGWPFSQGWVNLHASRFSTHVEHAVWGLPATPSRPISARPNQPLKVGVLCNFHLTLGTQKPLFERVPKDVIELHLFDRFAGHSGAAYLAPYAASYHALKNDTPEEFADAINRVQPDLLLSLVPRSIAYRMFELIDTPCIAHVCTGSDLMHHPRVSYHVFTQPEFGYGLRDGRVHCAFTDRPFGDVKGYASWLVCDARDLDRGPRRRWAAREPLIAWHGSLYKLCSDRFLDVIFDVLEKHRDARFEYFGRGAQVAEIARRAEARHVGSRVVHRGVAGFARNGSGELQPETFAALRDTLSRARVWPDSFPIGGGSARFEAYVSGVPSVHMAPTADPPKGPYEDGSLLELPWLEASNGVAHSRDEYAAMIERCLVDQAFAESLIAAQDAVTAAVLDADGWWRHMRACYDDWSRSARA
jgi:hypothetical protein